MKPTPQQTIRAALSQYRGDDLERAQHAFSRCTPKQMQEQYGASGKTRQAILDEYQQRVDQVAEAQAWVNTHG